MKPFKSHDCTGQIQLGGIEGEINLGVKIEIDCKVDILTYAVTVSGLEKLKELIGNLTSENTRVITHHLTPNALAWLLEKKIKVRFFDNHSKILLLSSPRRVIVGSFNITKKALTDGIETSVIFKNSKLYDSFRSKFDEIWEGISEYPKWRTHAFPYNIVCTRSQRPKIKPQEFQQKIVNQYLQLWSTVLPSKGDIISLPTGAGKTLVAAEIIKELFHRGDVSRVLWIAHKNELLHQAYHRVSAQMEGKKEIFIQNHVLNSEKNHSAAEEFKKSISSSIVFASQQVLGGGNLGDIGKFDFVVVDECHRYHNAAKTIQRINMMIEGVKRLGLSATKPRNKSNFDIYWKNETTHILGSEITIEWLVDEEFLSMEIPYPIDTGFCFEFSSKSRMRQELLSKVQEFNNNKVNEIVQKEFLKFKNKSKRILIFAVSIEHADELCKKINNEGVRTYHSHLSLRERNENISWFREFGEETKTLISVEMIVEGVDLPMVDCLFLVRPTWSWILHNQLKGRGLRGPKFNGTPECYIVDFTYQWVSADGEILTTPGKYDGEDDDCLDCSAPDTGGDLEYWLQHLIDDHGIPEKEIIKHLDVKYSTIENYKKQKMLSKKFREKAQDFIEGFGGTTIRPDSPKSWRLSSNNRSRIIASLQAQDAKCSERSKQPSFTIEIIHQITKISKAIIESHLKKIPNVKKYKNGGYKLTNSEPLSLEAGVQALLHAAQCPLNESLIRKYMGIARKIKLWTSISDKLVKRSIIKRLTVKNDKNNDFSLLRNEIITPSMQIMYALESSCKPQKRTDLLKFTDLDKRLWNSVREFLSKDSKITPQGEGIHRTYIASSAVKSTKEKVFYALKANAGKPVSLTDLSEWVGVKKSSLKSLLIQLIEEGSARKVGSNFSIS